MSVDTVTRDALKEKIKRSAIWLAMHPHFEEMPATIEEFLGPGYLNIEDRVRARVKEELVNIIGETVRADRPTKYPLAMITGGIGIGKTTFASIVLPYLCHWVLCLKDPQGYFNLLPGSRIAFMQMSTSEKQALEVVFGDIDARIKYSPWFSKYPRDPNFKNQIRFIDKDIWILPGDSAETTFEGYNILGGILDEADSHKITPSKNYAEQGYTTISARITSRFEDKGFLLIIGQMKSSQGFAAEKFKEFSNNPNAYAVRLAIWDSMGLDHFRDKETGEVHTFFYDTKRHRIVPSGAAKKVENKFLIEIPTTYERDFRNSPEKALRDLAGIPPAVGDPFISLTYKIDEARDRWITGNSGLGSPVLSDGKLERWFVAPNSLPRVAHIDLAYSATGDALGFAMGHVREMVVIDGERKPYISIDMLLRVKAVPGSEIFLADIRHFIYNLRDTLKFRLVKVTMDGFQSTDTRQQLERRRFEVDNVSVDKQILPYHDLREALYEDRIEFPPYMVYLEHGDTTEVEIMVKELSELVDTGIKIDHPDKGSKDVADSVAGVTFTLMGERRYHKKNLVLASGGLSEPSRAPGGLSHPAYMGDRGAHAPLPPSEFPWR